MLALVAAGCGDDTDEGTPDPPPDCLVSVELSGGYQASLSPDDPYAIYIRDAEGVERWPRGVVPLCI